jgi:amidase
MDSTDLAFSGPARQAELVRAGEVTSRELTELYLERIERLDPELNAYRTSMPERALAEADQADGRRASGGERPLLGVPVAVKDNTDVAGEVTTHGTGCFTEAATADSEVVRRLRDAGAVIIGKTNLPELAIIGATESPSWGVTRSPWDPERSTGGSSGGSAAAVAAGLCAAAHATDGAGSIRIPAANCGLVGMKPQRGRVSLMPDPQHWFGMSVAGALTRTVADQALMLDVLSGPAEGDVHTPPPPPGPFAEAAARTPGRLRVALSFRPSFPVPVHGEIRAAVSSLADVMRSLGHEVTEAEPAYNELGTVVIPRYLKGIQADADSVPRPQRLQRRTRGFAAMGRLVPQAALDNALRDEERQARRINEIFDDHDVVLSPTTAQPPVTAAEWEGMSAPRTMLGLMRTYPYTSQWNATGQPVLAVPTGFTAAGLPLGAQLIGRPHDEGTLLSLAAQVEAERPWADRRPGIS